MRTAFIIGMRLAAALVVAVLIGAAAACSSSTPDTHGRIPVVAGENFWGDVVRQVGGERVQVRSIINDPSADPHLYDSTARNAEAVASARLVVVNGLGYDDFMSQLLSTTSADDRAVITVAQLNPAVPEDANPHLWYDLDRVRTAAVAIEHELAKADPAHASAFAENRIRFNRSLQPIMQVLGEIRRHFSHAPVAYTERVPEYMLDAAGLNVV